LRKKEWHERVRKNMLSTNYSKQTKNELGDEKVNPPSGKPINT
jgi:hypothetical protein